MNTLSDAMLFELGIHVPAGEAAQFFYGDNVEGYYEGFTNRTAGGSGYWINGRPIFRDVVSRVGDVDLPHESAREAIILPHAILHKFRNASREVSILHRQRAVAITLCADKAQRLAVAPLFDHAVGKISVTIKGKGAVVSFADCPFHVGVSSSVPFIPNGTVTHGNLPAPVFATKNDVSSITLYLAFDEDADQALAKSVMLRDQDGLSAHKAAILDIVNRSHITTSDPDYNRAVAWAKLTSYFLVTVEFGKGIWAGLPWFKNNWGRDTFIALPGTLLVTGMFDDARDVILNFLRYQDTNPKSPTFGRVPNRVASATDIIYNTADGTPWLIRELYEYLQYTGDLALAKKVYPAIKLALTGAIKKFVDKEGFLTHDDADTWMDARIMGNLPWSARGSRANDIQALWHNALLIGVRLAGYAGDRAAARKWTELADKLRAHFIRRFWNKKACRLADRIDAKNRRDEKVRPNQLMVISVPMIEPLLNEVQSRAVVNNAVGELLYPYGIASLSQKDPYFHPYHHNDAWYHFDAAYHNGTVWGWNAGFAVTAMCRCGQTELAWKLARNLADQILHLGCRGSMSELIEAIPRKKNKLNLSGTWAQAWSTSEIARNAFQDFGGFHPRLLDNEIHLHPHIPSGISDVTASFSFGKNASLKMSFTRWGKQSILIVQMDDYPEPLTLHLTVELGNRRFAVEEPLLPGQPVILTTMGSKARLNNLVEVPGQVMPAVKQLRFVKPSLAAKPASIRKKHYLQEIIEAGKYV